MGKRDPGDESEQLLEQVLGYLNFSSGTPDAQFLGNLNRLFAKIDDGRTETPIWRLLLARLDDKLKMLAGDSSAFRDAQQADAIVGGLLEQALLKYRDFHRDLLFHQTEQSLMGPFFVGRVCEALLQQGPPWDEFDRIVNGSFSQLNDFIGHRPVATLQSQKIEPYAHEWVRPVPLFIREVGVSTGRHQRVIEAALELLRQTDDDILRSAHFDPALLDELAVDPRCYNFEHPVNRRPSYLFGQWDPHHLDNQGRYRRFVVQQITLDALLSRLDEATGYPHDEMLFEAAAVLAGTILMASGISGSGPDTHDSTTTLSTLLPTIAAYRDEFYQRLISRAQGSHAERLRAEAAELRQPFGGARHHLNAQLAHRRANQLTNVCLAKLFARMGYSEAAIQQADVVPVASARMLCRIECLLIDGHRAIQAGDLQRAASMIPSIRDMLERGIQCGAIVDPWNVLGFDAQYSYFLALENSIRDHRVDDLVEMMEQVFAFYSRLWSEAAALDQSQLCRTVDEQFRDAAQWWRQFAMHEVASVECPDAMDLFYAARHVARALNLWHQGGAAAGDIAFWSPHADLFDSPKGYGLVIEALLERGDYVASMALLIHWLAQSERIPLQQGDISFHQLAQRWLVEFRRADAEGPLCQGNASGTWPLIIKFFDFLEANAEHMWQVPQFELGVTARRDDSQDFLTDDEPPIDEAEPGLFGAAYEDVVYRDSTDDGVEGEIFDTSFSSDDELEVEAKRIGCRLAFLSTMARLWRSAAAGPLENFSSNPPPASVGQEPPQRVEQMQRWVEQAWSNHRQLVNLLQEVKQYRIAAPSGDHESMVDYDRRRLTKDSLLEQIIATSVETVDAARLLLASTAVQDSDGRAAPRKLTSEMEEDQRQSVEILAAVVRRDVDDARRRFPDFLNALSDAPMLYVPLSKGGDPCAIVTSRGRQQTIRDLLAWLPRLGLLTETCRLLETARDMERNSPIGPGAVTEFDDLFQIGYKSLVECLVASAACWNMDEKAATESKKKSKGPSQDPLVQCLEQLTETLLTSWLAHSRTLRLSVLEKVDSKKAWKAIVSFIERYGDELFSQRFLTFGNVRAILHQGVDAWLTSLQDDPYAPLSLRLLDELDGALPRDEAVESLTLVLEAVFENYAEYRDYNSTTTQSDRGSLLYTLLDFLRLRMKYDRVAWQLKPVVWAHEILVRRGRDAAAKTWRRSLSERFAKEADKYLQKLAALQKKYAMRMPTVADRLEERFVHPMIVDRICALVDPAMNASDDKVKQNSFDVLRHEAESLARVPTGAGLDVPGWLAALEDKVEAIRCPTGDEYDDPAADENIAPTLLTLTETRRQLNQCSNKERSD